MVWPIDIATYEDGHMVIRATTHPSSQLSIERVARGRTISMLTSATGRTYLAFCPPRERAAILELLAAMPATKRPAFLERELATTRERGYGLRIRGSHPKTSSIAVPLMRGGKSLLACLNINWIDSVLSPDAAVARCLESLRAAATLIGREYGARYGLSP